MRRLMVGIAVVALGACSGETAEEARTATPVGTDAAAGAAPAVDSAEAEVMTQLETVRGRAADERGTNAECGAGPLQYASWDDGLTAWLQDGAFVGWALNGEGGGASTMGGLGVGTTRAELDGGLTVVEVEETSLGQEFDAGGVFGVLDGAGETARVTSLWGGTSCNFR